MALNPETAGATTRELVHEYTWQDVALYALAVGAKAEGELDLLYEGRGPKVLPTYAVVPTYAMFDELLNVVGGDTKGVVHAGQTVRAHAPFGPSGKLRTVGRVDGVYDLKRMAQAVFASETRDERGTLLCETEWSIIFRNDGGFGGQAPPKTPRVHVPDRPPEFEVEEATLPEQALLYRIASGDMNPLHADPAVGEAVGFGGPILHGLCTYGFAARAIVQQACDGDPSRLQELSGQFRKPVWPGETLVTRGWQAESHLIVRTSVKEREDEAVFSNAYARIA